MLTLNLKRLAAECPRIQPWIEAMHLPRHLVIGCAARDVYAILNRWSPSVQIRITEPVPGGRFVTIRRDRGGQGGCVLFALEHAGAESRTGQLLYAMGAQSVMTSCASPTHARELERACTALLSDQNGAVDASSWIESASWFCALVWAGYLGFSPQSVLAELLLLEAESRTEGRIAAHIASRCPDWADASVWRDVLQSAAPYQRFADADDVGRHEIITTVASQLCAIVHEGEEAA